jgi:hypothetical protein
MLASADTAFACLAKRRLRSRWLGAGAAGAKRMSGDVAAAAAMRPQDAMEPANVGLLPRLIGFPS